MYYVPSLFLVFLFIYTVNGLANNTVCNGNGQQLRGNELLPPITSTVEVCVCNEGFAGDQCQYGTTRLQLNSQQRSLQP